MIIKVSRIAKSNREWSCYVKMPDTYSFYSAVKYIKKSKRICKDNTVFDFQLVDPQSLNPKQNFWKV